MKDSFFLSIKMVVYVLKGVSILDISYRGHVTNDEARNSISHAIGPYKDLLTTIRNR